MRRRDVASVKAVDGAWRRQGDADAGVTEIGVAHHSPSVSVQQGAGQDFGARQMCPAGVTR